MRKNTMKTKWRVMVRHETAFVFTPRGYGDVGRVEFDGSVRTRGHTLQTITRNERTLISIRDALWSAFDGLRSLGAMAHPFGLVAK